MRLLLVLLLIAGAFASWGGMSPSLGDRHDGHPAAAAHLDEGGPTAAAHHGHEETDSGRAGGYAAHCSFACVAIIVGPEYEALALGRADPRGWSVQADLTGLTIGPPRRPPRSVV